ncbi:MULTISPECIES: pantoate--beta-alanine ligase [unclassified Methylophaga]|jgi:pantoate--beta-alanine ligase|uniref:pantoate--beta-alanine ligase n=1 Tax=unclassified Methylophaga TaxID=2629249 RepID=UPI00259CD01D|nr:MULTISPECIES: pantoate--beta-alanine ligase [unclassified Methylophaga]|tara:strand:- start:3178 stop:4032 length:855 start_codon:yes stop_codon:yes gene_type:complete
MAIAENLGALRTRIKSWRQQNEVIALVPTMGNLHEGHLSLVQKARELADRVVVSIFVNPLQFNDKQDLSDYPRTLNEDIQLLSELDCELIFTPTEEMIYPNGMASLTKVIVPGVDDKLCGKGRPGHFDGVATVVTKLFNMVQPDIAIFGEKDYQQLMLIKKLVADLNLSVDVIGVPTKRHESGLAMSSRNSLLNQKQLVQAPLIYKTLLSMKQAIEEDGLTDFHQLCATAKEELQKAGLEPEYVDIRRANDLELANANDKHIRIFVAARLGSVRLIDNIACDLA